MASSVVGQQSQTTQTALAAVGALGRQLAVISTPIAMTTNNTTTGLTSNRNHQRHRHPVVHRINGSVLYEGSHIHFSPIDNKPLCSYSTKLCKQRRINGYAFCIRHILEDPSAPFRQCIHVAKYNQQKCSNAIPANEDRLFCNSHMQIAGMAPKKERKDKKSCVNNNNNQTLTTITTIATHCSNDNNIQNKCLNNNNNNTTIDDKMGFSSQKLTNFNAFIKPNLKLNGITSSATNGVINNTITANNCQLKSTEKSTNTSLTTAPVVSSETSNTSHSNNSKFTENHLKSNSTEIKSKTNNKNTFNCNKRPKRKKKDKKSVDKFVFARKSRTKGSDNLFNYHIWSETDDEVDDNNETHSEDVFPLIFGTLTTNIEDLEPNELKTELIAEKWLLQNLISVRKRDFETQFNTTRDILKTLNTTSNKRYNYLDYKLSESTRRLPNSIRKGICCYSSEDIQCRRPSLPLTRHCVNHILYNVDQLLFSRCTAKCAQTMTQCSNSTFDIINGEPLCHYHQMLGSEVDERSNSPSSEARNKKRRKSKPMALTRVSRRGKKRRKGINGSDVPITVEDSIESLLSVGSIDDDSLQSQSDTNDITINILTQKEHNIQTTDIEHSITQSIPQTTITTTADIAPDIPLMRLPPIITASVVSSVAPVVPMPAVVLDHTVMPPPPPLEPTEEALVASIVADLPQLTSDADFTEVLNKIPDEAFSDFLLEHQNGEIPTTEETEALEQALAMVNKDVQNLVAAAGMNGTTSSAQSLSDLSGQSDIIGFSNWLGSLTTEQRQQLNGLIDGAIASNSLSPILKNACEAYPQTLVQMSTTPQVIKTSNTTALNQNTNAFPVVYPINQISLAPTPQQEFVPILNNNLLINGLSSHPS